MLSACRPDVDVPHPDCFWTILRLDGYPRIGEAQKKKGGAPGK
jgi:hypothetical protein